MSDHQILNANDHAGLRVHSGAGAQFGDNVMACLTVPQEFRQVQGHFPILFRRDISNGIFSAVALFGFENGENLFLEGDCWDSRYRPLALAIQPFLIGRAATESETAQVHIDMASPRISNNGEGTLLFDEDGRPTPYTEAIAQRLANLEQGYRGNAAFFGALERYGLLEPFTLEVPLNDGSRHSLVGYHIIDEAQVAALDGSALAALHSEGHLLPMFMAMASLSRLGDLVARKNARVARG